MATQLNISSIAPLSAVALLTSICVIISGETHASDLSAQSPISAINALGNWAQHNATPAADAVAEARWAREHDDYVLGKGGRISPDSATLEHIKTGAIPIYQAETEDNLFGGYSQPDSVQGAPECGPSPATPAEIARLVIAAAQRHEVDVGFAIAVVTAESRLDRLRNSPKGARGPMQLLPETAERFGVTDICDPKENIETGVRYLRELTDEFRNPLLVAAAYNAGEGRVREYGGIPPFKETLGYVAEVVNIQMRLEGSGLVARGPADAAIEPRQSSNVSGVITSHKRRQWVGGVMHF